MVASAENSANNTELSFYKVLNRKTKPIIQVDIADSEALAARKVKQRDCFVSNKPKIKSLLTT